MAEYRWNLAEHATGYDASAEYIHPHYLELQSTLLDLLPAKPRDEFLVVDLGGGSGRLAERFLERFDRATAIVVDQSAAFLDIAARRMERFGSRGKTHLARLQDDWPSALDREPLAIVSMSAIHHLEPREKQTVYRVAQETLAPAGVLLNGDEVRPPGKTEYLQELKAWAEHMHRIMKASLVPPVISEVLLKWEDRNINHFDLPRSSGDDIHETTAIQLGYLRQAGFGQVDVPWHKDLWAVLRGIKVNRT